MSHLTWKDGVATVYAENPLANRPGQPTPRLSFIRSKPLELLMSEKSASKIRKGAIVYVDALLIACPPTLFPDNARTNAQVLFSLQHSRIPGQPIGVAASRDLEVTIDKVLYPCRWNAPEQEKGEDKDKGKTDADPGAVSPAGNVR
ncbi:MAG: hypothetical protein KF688_00970 [Pirellulales bacterium]|nr:hypothetical protein [Pirellulales bacterium]